MKFLGQFMRHAAGGFKMWYRRLSSS